MQQQPMNTQNQQNLLSAATSGYFFKRCYVFNGHAFMEFVIDEKSSFLC